MSTTEILEVIAVVVVFTVILTLISKAKQKQTWTGTLLKKKIDDGSLTTGDDLWDIQTYYILIFRTDAGKKVKVNVSKAMFDAYAVGRRFIKKSGANFPEPM